MPNAKVETWNTSFYGSDASFLFHKQVWIPSCDSELENLVSEWQVVHGKGYDSGLQGSQVLNVIWISQSCQALKNNLVLSVAHSAVTCMNQGLKETLKFLYDSGDQEDKNTKQNKTNPST
jgi:hypothetical protein